MKSAQIAAEERIRHLLRPDTPVRTSPQGYLDVLPAEPEDVSATRSQALWMKRRGPRVYLRLIQPIVRSLGAPPGGAELAAGLRLAPGADVLDVGCGPGVITAGLARAVAPQGFAVGLDISPPMLARAAGLAPANLGLLRGDARRLPFPDETFDAVCATAVLMLLGDTATALAEFARVLKPGGWLGAVVPCSSDGLAGRLGAAVGRVAGGRMFGADEIPGLVEALDFDRVRSQTTNGLISTTYARKSPDL